MIDIPELTRYGWTPVTDTSNAILTESFLSILDIVETNTTNLTDLAVRTPFSSNHGKAKPVHKNIEISKFNNVSSMKRFFSICRLS